MGTVQGQHCLRHQGCRKHAEGDHDQRPHSVAFMVYKSFMSYKSGVYKKHFWELLPEGGHAVKMVGWGVEDGHDYWLVANSWSTTWGIEGLFKIARGINACGIEKMGPPYAGLPATRVDD